MNLINIFIFYRFTFHLSQKSCSRYCLLFKASRHGIARLEICENKDDKNPKIFTLENCVKITQEPPPANLIQIVKRNGQLTLNTNSDEELKDWVTALQTVAFCDNSGLHAAHGAIEEDNDLYCSSFVSKSKSRETLRPHKKGE